MRLFFLFSLRRALPAVFTLLTAFGARAQQPAAKPFKLHLDNYRGSLQWEQSPDHVTWSDVPNGQGGDLTILPTQTTYYRAKITEPACTPLYSDVKAAYVYKSIVLAAKLIQGKLVMPTGPAVDLTQYTVKSLLDANRPMADGRFELLVADSTAEDLLLVTNPKQEVVLLGNVYGPRPEYTLSAETSGLALLMMYPGFKPVSTDQKGALIQAYKKEPEFLALTQAIEEKIKLGQNLYTDNNITLTPLLLRLLKKSFNGPRLGRPTSTNPVDILDQGGAALTLKNNVAPSYAGGLYRTSDHNLVATFLVAGSSLSNSPWRFLFGRGDATSTVPFDFNKATLPGGGGMTPGEYTIMLRNGLAFDGSPEDDVAVYENARDALISIADNVFTNFLELSKSSPQYNDKCANAFLGASVNSYKASIKSTLNANSSNPSILLDLALPILSEQSQLLGECSVSQIAPNFLSKAFESTVRFKNLRDALPTAQFFLEWFARSKAIDGCKYVFTKGGGFQAVNCFTMEKNTGLTDAINHATNYVCDELDAQVQLKEKTNYYPYNLVGQPIEGFDIFWRVLEGGGSLLSGVPGFAGNLSTTNALGNAKMRWKVGDKPNITQQLAAQVVNPDLTVKQHIDFSTTSVVPKPKVVPKGDQQPATPGQVLPDPLIVGLKDLLDDLPMLIDRFDLKWEVVQGGGTLLPAGTNANTPFSEGRLWQLGPGPGDQKVKVTIVNKACDPWQIEGNPVIFTATAASVLHLELVSGDNQTGAISTALPLPVRVRVLDAQGVPQSGISISFAAAGDSGSATPALVASDANGYAQATWTLGVTAGAQTLTVTGRDAAGQTFASTPALFSATGLATTNMYFDIGAGSVSGTTNLVIKNSLNQVVVDMHLNYIATTPPLKLSQSMSTGTYTGVYSYTSSSQITGTPYQSDILGNYSITLLPTVQGLTAYMQVNTLFAIPSTPATAVAGSVPFLLEIR